MMVMASALIVFYSVFAYQHEKAEYAKESVSELKAITQVLENDYATLVLNGAPNLREELLRKWQQFPVLEHADLAGGLGRLFCIIQNLHKHIKIFNLLSRIQ